MARYPQTAAADKKPVCAGDGARWLPGGRLKPVMDAVRAGIFCLDSTSHIVYANPEFGRLLGQPHSMLMGRPIGDFLEPPGSKGGADVCTEIPGGREWTLRAYGGEITPLRVILLPSSGNGSPGGVFGIATRRDLTRCDPANDSELLAFNERILNAIAESLFVFDPTTGLVIYGNDAFHARVRMRPPTALGRPCYRVLFHRERPCHEDGMNCPLKEGSDLLSMGVCEHRVQDEKGREVHWRVRIYPVRGKEDRAEWLIGLEEPASTPAAEPKPQRREPAGPGESRWNHLLEDFREAEKLEKLPELLDFVCRKISDTFRGSETLFLLSNLSGDGFLPLAECAPEIANPVRRFLASVGQSDSLPRVVRTLESVDWETTSWAKAMERFPPWLRDWLAVRGSWFALPLRFQRRWVGTLFVSSGGSGRVPDGETVDYLKTFLLLLTPHIRHLVVLEAGVNAFGAKGVEPVSHAGIIGYSKKMLEVYELIDLVSSSDATVLITGENGTGKELVAQAIHRQSHRQKGPFVVAHCSAYSPALLESELFGHEKGAFTGAIRKKMGRIERAQGGTLFLDEIGDIAPATQVLLLRFLQDHRFERVGGEETLEADVRVLAATNRDLVREVEAGNFRDDLYYRLNVVSVHLPPLRERKEDIALLCQHFLRKYNTKEGKEIQGFSSGALQAFMDYDWPGNVRQLENAVSHAVIVAQENTIRRSHLPRFLKEESHPPVSTSLADNERRLILKALRESGWNKHEAARRLQVSRSTLYGKIQRYGLRRENGGLI